MFDRLSEDQRQVLNIVGEGHNIFITGQDGTARKNNYLLSSIFSAGKGGFGQMMYRSPEGHLRTPGMEFFCTVPRPHFLGRALIWPGCFGEHILGLFGLYSSSLSSLWDSFLYLGKLHWFLYLLLSYFYDPGMFIFCWSSNFVENVVSNESMSAKMASRVS